MTDDPHEAWYGYGRWDGAGLKAIVSDLVGWGRQDQDPVLGSTDAYDIVYEHVLGLCRRPRTDMAIGAEAKMLVMEAYIDEATDRLKGSDEHLIDRHLSERACRRCGSNRVIVGAGPAGFCVRCALEAAELALFIRPRLAIDCCHTCDDDGHNAYTPDFWAIDGGVTCWYHCGKRHQWLCHWSLGAVTGTLE